MIYEIKNFIGALSDWEDRGRLGSFKFGSNIKIHKNVDSLSCNQALLEEGQPDDRSPSLSPSPSSSVSISASASMSPSPSATPSQSNSASVSPSASYSPSSSVSPSASVSLSPSPSAGTTTVFRDLILFFVKASDGYTYGFGDQGYIYRRDAAGFWQYVYHDANGRIIGAAEGYGQEDKATYLFWATSKIVNRKEIIRGDNNWGDVNKVGSVQGDSWPKNNLTPATWHTMCNSGGSTAIANGNFLALIGYDQSYTNEALDLIPGNIATTVLDRAGRVITGTAPLSNPTKGINAAIDAEYPLLQVGDDGDLFINDFSSKVPFKRFPGGGKCNPGGVANEVDQSLVFEWEETALSWINKQNIGNMALFAIYGADAGKNGVYSVGRINSNKPFVMNLEYALEADELGALTVVNGNVLVSYRIGSQIGVRSVDPNNKAVATYEGLDFHSPVKEAEKITDFKKVELFMAPLPDNASVEFWYKMNKTGNFIQAKCANGNLNYNIVNGQKAVFLIAADGDIYEPKIVLNPGGNNDPEVFRVRTYFI